jgi:hypothetical protein
MKDEVKKVDTEEFDMDNTFESSENNLTHGSGYTRGSLPKKGLLDILAKKAEDIKHQSIELGKIAAREAEVLGEKIDGAVDDGLDAAKKLKPKSSESKSEMIDLLERLAKLKEQGIITEKEFNAKKKDLLSKI